VSQSNKQKRKLETSKKRMKQDSNNSEWQNLSILQKVERVQLIALYPALTVMPFLRAKIGYRVVRPNALYSMATIMIAGSLFLPVGNKTGLVVYALAMVAAGLFHRNMRWRGICNGEKWHTLSTGNSYLELIKWPKFFRHERRIQRFLDPLLCFLVAGIVWLLKAHGLAFWLLIAGFALFIWEQGYYERVLNRILDLYDGEIDSAMQQEIMKNLGKQPAQTNKALEDVGYPTGIGTDIYAGVMKMKQSKNETSIVASLQIQTA
jgi:hypothetical protein